LGASENVLEYYTTLTSLRNKLDVTNLDYVEDNGIENTLRGCGKYVSKYIDLKAIQHSDYTEAQAELKFRKFKYGDTNNVKVGENLGKILWQGYYDGWLNAASIEGEVVNTTGASAMPGILSLKVSKNGSSTLSTKMDMYDEFIRVYGQTIRPRYDGGTDLGSIGYGWNYLYLDTAAAVAFNDEVYLAHSSGKLTLSGGNLYLPSNGLLINDINVLYGETDTISQKYVKIADSASYAPGGYETPTNVDNKILSTIGEGIEGVVLADSQTVFVTPTQLATELTGYTTTEALSDSLAALSIEGALMEADSTKYVTIKRLTDTIANLRYEIRNFELQFDQIYAALDELAEEDFTPPRFESAEVGDSANNLFVCVMDAADINADSIPDPSAFGITENGNEFGIDAITISNDTIYITGDSTAMYGATYLLSYTRPVSGALQDTIGNKTASWVNKPVTNNVVPSDLLSGLIAYWKFDEESGNAIDATGNGFDLTTFVDVTRGVEGKFGKAYEFTTEDAYVRVPYNEAFVDSFKATGQYTISMLIYLNDSSSVVGREQKLIWWRHTTALYFVNATVTTGNHVNVYTADEVPNYVRGSSANNTVLSDTWYHILITADEEGSLKVYIDGVHDDTRVGTFENPFLHANHYLTIGGDQSNGMLGKIQNVGFWNRVLSDQEITDLETFYDNNKNYPFE